MDHELIYAKTASGERAMLERTRTMPRNVRMVLILVDSQSSVGDLCLKTGNPQMTESALRDLELGGFIEPRRQNDSLWDEEERLAREIREVVSDTQASIKAAQPTEKLRPAASVPASEVTAGTGKTAALPVAPLQLAAVPTLAQGGTTPPLATESPSSIGKRFKELFSKPPSASDEAADLGPPERRTPQLATMPETRTHRRRNVLGWPARVTLTLLVGLVGLALTVALFPYAHYVPELEAAMASACGRPVRIATLRVDFNPKLVLRLDDVRLGDGADALHIAELRLTLMPGSLLASRKVFSSAVVRGVTLPAETLVGLPALFSELAKSDAHATVKRFTLENTVISLGAFASPSMGGDFVLSPSGEFSSLRLSSPENTLTLTLTPQRQGAKVTGLGVVGEAIGWRPAADSALLFDTANLAGSYAGGVFTVNRAEFRLFDGLIAGSAVLFSHGTKNVSGEATFKHLSAARLSNAFGFAQQLAGDVDGSLRFAAKGDTWATLGASLDADGEFSIDRGSLRGIDLSEAARRVSQVPVLGGETKFESLSGKLRLSPASWRVSELVLTSGLMQSTGNIEVRKDLALAGRMELRTRGTASQARVPLLIGGTLRAPSVLAGRGE